MRFKALNIENYIYTVRYAPTFNTDVPIYPNEMFICPPCHWLETFPDQKGSSRTIPCNYIYLDHCTTCNCMLIGSRIQEHLTSVLTL